MSYLVDALKKAERERHERRGADIQSVASDGAGRSGAARVLRWVVVALVVCNLGLLLYVIWPPPQDAKDSAATTGAGAAAAAPERDKDIGALSDALRLNPEAQSTSPDAEPIDHSSSPTPARDLDASARPEAPNPVPPAASERAQSARGQVTYAPAPLDNRPALPQTAQQDVPSIRELGGRVPDVTINGHLYSSVPGRSFILVKGRRYHEGERMNTGPAVESIDAAGATLNYRGQRYHINGPG